ncbi:MAG: rane protein [Pedosphaera sp.]|nr:rane protein [Pedosphaera sp.]
MNTNAKNLADLAAPMETAVIIEQCHGSLFMESLGWLPLILLPALTILLRNSLVPWAFMWAEAAAIFFGCKWLTWYRCQQPAIQPWRNWAYFLAWPGLDAKAFLCDRAPVQKPVPFAWITALLITGLGAALLWGTVRMLPASSVILTGWCGLLGLIFVLHFGTFHLLALAWQQIGVNARPLMRAPILATSLGEFWGQRWNSAFNQVVHAFLFRPFHRQLGLAVATMGVFLASGMIHELVLSVPARAGYGLPTLYFLLQGAGILAEHTALGTKISLRHGIIGWCFTVALTAIPAFWLFHPPFITRVIIPFLHAIHAF